MRSTKVVRALLPWLLQRGPFGTCRHAVTRAASDNSRYPRSKCTCQDRRATASPAFIVSHAAGSMYSKRFRDARDVDAKARRSGRCAMPAKVHVPGFFAHAPDQQEACRDAVKIDKTRMARLTRHRRVARACQSSLQKPSSGVDSTIGMQLYRTSLRSP